MTHGKAASSTQSRHILRADMARRANLVRISRQAIALHQDRIAKHQVEIADHLDVIASHARVLADAGEMVTA